MRYLPVDAAGRLDIDAAASYLETNPPALLHLTALGSHRGTVQPATETAAMCRSAGVPLIVDAAQAFAHLDCAGIGADVVYSTSRKWTAGPRGVGWLATRPGWLSEQTLLRLAHGEVSVAAQVGLSVALGEHVAAGPERVRSRLAEVGAQTRTALADVPGWRVIEPVDEPSAITTLDPPDGVDPAQVRARLIDEHRIVTTYLGVERAPNEMTRPALRVSPHVDVTADDLDVLAAALARDREGLATHEQRRPVVLEGDRIVGCARIRVERLQLDGVVAGTDGLHILAGSGVGVEIRCRRGTSGGLHDDGDARLPRPETLDLGRAPGVLEQFAEPHTQIVAAERRFLTAAEDELLAKRELVRIGIGFAAHLTTNQSEGQRSDKKRPPEHESHRTLSHVCTGSLLCICSQYR